MTTPSPNTLVVYSDYLCPFCYLGKVSLESYLESAEASPEIDWRPYDIQGPKRGPDGELRDEQVPGKDEAYFERVWRNVEHLAEEFDVEMKREVPEKIDSWNAQKLALYVNREGDRETFGDLHDRLFEALWRDGLDIGRPEILAEIGEDLDLEADQTYEVLESSELDTALSNAFAEAHDRGVFAIPTFIYENYALRGAVDPERLGRFLEGT